MESKLKQILDRPLKIVGLPGSLRKTSFHAGVLSYIKNNLGIENNILFEIADVNVPPFNQDDETKDGKNEPESVQKLKKLVNEADCFILAATEYNYSFSGVLKNALDWCSRGVNGNLFADKTAAIFGAGGGMGTARSQYHVRQVSVFLNLDIINKELFIQAFEKNSQGEYVFDFQTGELLDNDIKKRAMQQILALKEYTIKKKMGKILFEDLSKLNNAKVNKKDEEIIKEPGKATKKEEETPGKIETPKESTEITKKGKKKKKQEQQRKDCCIIL